MVKTISFRYTRFIPHATLLFECLLFYYKNFLLTVEKMVNSVMIVLPDSSYSAFPWPNCAHDRTTREMETNQQLWEPVFDLLNRP